MLCHTAQFLSQIHQRSEGLAHPTFDLGSRHVSDVWACQQQTTASGLGNREQQTTASGLANLGFLRFLNLVYCHGELQRPVGDLEPKTRQSSKAQKHATYAKTDSNVKHLKVKHNTNDVVHKSQLSYSPVSSSLTRLTSTIPKLTQWSQGQITRDHLTMEGVDKETNQITDFIHLAKPPNAGVFLNTVR